MKTTLERIVTSLEELANKECWHDVSDEVKGRYDAFIQAADVVRKHVETDEQSRQRFEAWLLSCGEVRKYLERDSNGRYRDNDTHVAWQAWQASQTFTEASE